MNGRNFWSRLGKNKHRKDKSMIPHEVVSQIVDGATPIRAWREHLNPTQEEVAKRMGISQPAFAQQETVAKPRKATREKIAAAFGITSEQLEL
jgi:predicted transcriptional regulator